jgi:hypothetical protein
VEIDYGFHRCSNCGREAFMWGVKIDKTTFICDMCVKDIDKKIEDRKDNAQRAPKSPYTFGRPQHTTPLKVKV